MRTARLLVLTVSMCCAALGCGGIDNSVQKPDNPVPPPQNAPREAGATTTTTLPATP
jgi:hypothetical protein